MLPIGFMMRIGAGVAAFAAGFVVATWRDDAHAAREIAQRETAYRETVAKMVTGIIEDNARTAERENALVAVLGGSRQEAEGLRREIADRPVIRQVVSEPVAGRCAPVPSLGWSVFADLYNRAATGAPAEGAPDAGHAVVPVVVADVAQ